MLTARDMKIAAKVRTQMAFTDYELDLSIESLQALIAYLEETKDANGLLSFYRLQLQSFEAMKRTRK